MSHAYVLTITADTVAQTMTTQLDIDATLASTVDASALGAAVGNQVGIVLIGASICTAELMQ